MRWLPRLEYEPKSGPIRYSIFRQSPNVPKSRKRPPTSKHSRCSAVQGRTAMFNRITD